MFTPTIGVEGIVKGNVGRALAVEDCFCFFIEELLSFVPLAVLLLGRDAFMLVVAAGGVAQGATGGIFFREGGRHGDKVMGLFV